MVKESKLMSKEDKQPVKAQEWVIQFNGKIRHSEKTIYIHTSKDKSDKKSSESR